MKRLLLLIGIILTGTVANSQNRGGYDTALVETFDLLNNKHFAEIQLEDTSGQMFHTSSLLGKTIYVDFWFTACAPCVEEIPYAKALHEFFKDSTDIVFLSICIENTERKPIWKKMVEEKQMPGIQLFYDLNKPQKINLPREYKITFPTYVLVNKNMKVIGFDAPRPSEEGWVHWVISQANKDSLLSTSYKQFMALSAEYVQFANNNKERIAALRPSVPKQ